jgi:monoamine oxidase
LRRWEVSKRVVGYHRQMIDCVVIGGGFAGLAAADRLLAAGASVHLLEARDRVGGRVCTVDLGGTPIDIGGQWLGPTQDRMYALCERFGMATYPMHVAGQHLLSLDGGLRGYRGHIPYRVPPWTLANLGWLLANLERLARRIPLDAPWSAPDARQLDQQTLGDWLRRHAPDPRAYTLAEIGVEAVFAAGPDEISLLHALFYMRSGGSFDALTRSDGGAQQDRVSGGIQPVAEALASDLQRRNAAVTLESPVHRIAQHDDHLLVESEHATVRARYGIVALPPPLVSAIDFDPPLSDQRRQLLERTPMGSVIKCVAVYPEPFWRYDGRSGQAIGGDGPVRATFDASPASGTPGVLLGFIEGAAARDWAERSENERREAALTCFAHFFGERALSPTHYLDRAWAKEPFSGGCYAALFPPGVWTELGPSIREPHGRVHWAGTETARVWNGYIEGAVLSGDRAASEVVQRDV